MLTISFRNGTFVDIEDSVLAVFQLFQQRNPWSKEAGGVLIGKQVENDNHYVLSAISTPTKYDKQTRCSFTRSIKSAQPFIDERWRNSGGIENYIGEWHTHPEITPVPSRIDKALIRQVVLDKSSPFSKVILIIVGLNGTIYIEAFDAESTGFASESQIIEVNYEHIRSEV